MLGENYSDYQRESGGVGLEERIKDFFCVNR